MPYPNPRPPAPNGPGTCPRCFQAVIWCLTTANRKAQMVNTDRDPAGNTAIRIDHVGRHLSRQLSKERPTPEAGEHLHIPHIATCPVPAPRQQPRIPTARGRVGVRPHRWQR